MKSTLRQLLVAILSLEAKLVLKAYKPKIIAVTGNVGKTSTKDAIAAALKTKYTVRKSKKSFNSEFGVPLTILGAETGWSNPFKWLLIVVRGIGLLIGKHTYPEYLVLETGVDKPGDMKSLTSWLSPDTAVLTQFGEILVHIENFTSREQMVEEKALLPKALKKDGTFIWNGDDIDTKKIAEGIDCEKMSFGYGAENELRVEDEEILYSKNGAPIGFSGTVVFGEQKEKVTLTGVLGRSHLYAVLAGAAIAISEGVDLKAAITAMAESEHPKGRMKLISGIKNTTLIDDTYNASPKATLHALETLRALDISGKKIALLGDMLELGKHSEEAHKKIGMEAATSCHSLVTVGIRARGIAEGALNAGMKDENIYQFENSREAGKFAESLIKKGDVVLIKGSQGMRMERAVLELLLEPDKAEELLVRQDKEWLAR